MVHTNITLYVLRASHYPKICLPVRAGSDFFPRWKRLGATKADSCVRSSCTAAVLQLLDLPISPVITAVLSSPRDMMLSSLRNKIMMDKKYPRMKGCSQHKINCTLCLLLFSFLSKYLGSSVAKSRYLHKTL